MTDSWKVRGIREAWAARPEARVRSVSPEERLTRALREAPDGLTLTKAREVLGWGKDRREEALSSVGYLNGLRAAGVLDKPVERDRPVPENAAEFLRDKAWRSEATMNTTPPWKSDSSSRACGVEPPSEVERHTAMGDAKWAMRWYDTITGANTDA